MRNIVFFLFFLTPMLVFTQNLSVSIPDIFNSYEEASIHFNDGTSIRGYAKITLNSSIKFKVTDDSKPDVWTELMAKGVTIHTSLNDIDFQYVKLKKVRTPMLLEVIELGEISLFVNVSSSWVRTDDYLNNSPKSLNIQSSHKSTNYEFFLKKEHEEEAIRLFGIFNFRKKAITYFENCPQIVDRLKERKYKRADIVEMVYYYNIYCAALENAQD